WARRSRPRSGSSTSPRCACSPRSSRMDSRTRRARTGSPIAPRRIRGDHRRAAACSKLSPGRTRNVEETMSAIEYAVTNPATGEKLKSYDLISDDDLRAAIGRAHAARQPWGRDTTVEERAKIIGRVAELHAERRQELAEIITREMGKPIEQALGEVDFSAAIYQYYADGGVKLLADEPIELLDGDGSAFIRR